MIKSIHALIPEKWNIDGGVAFGVVPKGIWGKQINHIGSDNNIPIVNRCLLVETKTKLILVNTGFGNKRDEKYYNYKYINFSQNIEKCINKIGYDVNDITDVLFTHLHDDHCGGATKYNSNNESEIIFKNARFWISKNQWEWAVNPNPREAASYFLDNLMPLKNSGNLNLLEDKESPFLYQDIEFRYFNGHTNGQIIPFLKFNDKILVYVSDFIPSIYHIPIPYVASVDIFPLIALQEKQIFLEEAFENNYFLIFEHDNKNEVCTVGKNEKGYFAKEILSLQDIL